MRYTCAWILIAALTGTAQAQGGREATGASYLDRGNSWFAKGEMDRAIADFNLAIEFDPNSANAYYNRGLVRHFRGEPYAIPVPEEEYAIQAENHTRP